MSTRTIAQITTTVQQNCAWAVALTFLNSDGSPFDLTNITLTGQFRLVANPGTPIATVTFTTATPASGVTVAAISAHDAGLLPAGNGTRFNQLNHVVLEVNGAHSSDPQNPFRLAEGDVSVSPGGNLSPTATAAPTVPLDSISLVVGAVSASAARAMLGLNDGAVLPLATAVSPGAMPATRLTQTQMNSVSDAMTAGGWTVPKIIYSAAITAAATVNVTGLVSSRKYTFHLQLNSENIATANVMFQPNGSDANGYSFYLLDTGTPGNAAGLYSAAAFLNKATVSKTVIEPRINGVSSVSATGKQSSSSGLGAIILASGYTTTDYTSMTVNLGANARTGYLTVIEETPASSVLASAFFLPDVANAFDPSVSGLVGRVGAQVGTIDGTKAWVKIATPNTSWVSVSA
jgi:hypothetical protein